MGALQHPAYLRFLVYLAWHICSQSNLITLLNSCQSHWGELLLPAQPQQFAFIICLASSASLSSLTQTATIPGRSECDHAVWPLSGHRSTPRSFTHTIVCEVDLPHTPSRPHLVPFLSSSKLPASFPAWHSVSTSFFFYVPIPLNLNMTRVRSESRQVAPE